LLQQRNPYLSLTLLNSLCLLLKVTSSGVAVSRLPGLAVYYTDTLKGLPQVFEQLLATAPTLHKVIVFLHIRQVRPRFHLQPALCLRPHTTGAMPSPASSTLKSSSSTPASAHLILTLIHCLVLVLCRMLVSRVCSRNQQI
jgi:hypothetical protein